MKQLTLSCSALCAALLLLLGWNATAANITLKLSDPLGTSSWTTNGSATTSTNWSDGLVPAVANDYFTLNLALRTPNPATNAAAGTNPPTFVGNSLSIDPGGQLLMKHFGNLTVLNLKLNGGLIFQGDNFPMTNYGTILLNATTNSYIGSDTPARTLDVRANIIGTGTANLVISNIWGTAGPTNIGVLLSGTNLFTNNVAISNAYVKLNSIQALGATNG